MTERRGAFAWYELLTTDAAGARDFYGRVFGWQARNASTSAFAYSIFSAGKIEIGGLMELPPDARRAGATPHWVGYVEVDDIDRAADRLKRLGGSVLVPPTDSNIGRVSIVADPQRATFGMVGGLKLDGNTSEVMEPGQVGWHELFAADGKQAFAFYSELFGWPQGAGDSYHLVTVGGRMIGGMFTKLPRTPPPFWLYYFEVADIADAVAQVKGAGGRVLQGPLELPDGCWIVRCSDPQGAMFSLQGKSSQSGIESAAVGELNWAADWGGFASRGRMVGKPKG